MTNLKNLTIGSLIFILSACQTVNAIQDDVDALADGVPPMAQVHTGTTESLLKNQCPEVQIVDDLSSLSDFEDPKKTSKKRLVSRVDLKSAESTCKIASKSVTVDLKLIFNGALGEKGREKSSDKPFFSYPFFVAVTAPNGKIMAKEIFAASLTYGPNEQTHTYFEKLRQIIPIQNKSKAHMYKVLIGFQVTPDQLKYNRKNMVPIPQ
ncbi:MAG: hypothetical protein ACRBDL_10050 [Alphaproteobacteria bacterium]